MKSLFIFDSTIRLEKVPFKQLTQQGEVYLFPLSSKSEILRKIEGLLTQEGTEICILPSADLLNKSAENIRDMYIKLIAELPDKVKVDNQNLKEWFAVDQTLSLWWLSLVSEKNTSKSEFFNKLVQLDAIVDVIKEKGIEKIFFGCRNNKLKKALSIYAVEHSIELILMPAKKVEGLKRNFWEFQRFFYLRHILLLVRFATNFFLRTLAIKQRIGKLKRDVVGEESLLLITPYPTFDIGLAEKGIFQNKLYHHLQEGLEAQGRKITWIAIFADNNSLSLDKSLEYAENFIKNGYAIFFTEEFNSAGIQFKSFMAMMKCGLKFLRIEKTMAQAMRLKDYNFYPILRDDCYLSFSGKEGYYHLIFYYIWQKVLKQFKAEKCLYYCEMHAWEKALILAGNAVKNKIPLLAYQHATVSRMLLNYFNDPLEMRYDAEYNIPQPDKIICNGEIPLDYMKESGWAEDKLVIAEAIRYDYLKKYGRHSVRKKNVVLLALSIGEQESASLLNIVLEAIQDLNGIAVWVKPHPFLSMDKVFKCADIPREDFCFDIKNEPIEELLPEVRIVIAGQSGVSVEALAAGCEVITLNIPEQINMSPLTGTRSSLIWNISSCKELREIVIEIMSQHYDSQKHMQEAGKIINRYFYLNPNSNNPRSLLRILESSN